MFIEVILKECIGSISSSSSDPAMKFRVRLSPGRLEVPRNSDMSGPAEVVKWEDFLGLIGEDWASWCWSFQAVWLASIDLPAVGEKRYRLRELEFELGCWKLL